MSGTKTTIKGELNLCFDNSYDVYQITKALGIEPTDCKNQYETRINPITGRQNVGYWSIETESIETWDLKDVIKILLRKVLPITSKIKKILVENDGEAIFMFVPGIENQQLPKLGFDREFLEVVEELKATIDFDMYMY